MFFALFIAVLLPVTMCVWLVNVFMYSFYSNQNVWEPVSPVRCVLAVIVPALMAHYGLRRKSLSKSGAQSGFLIGLIMTLSSYCFMASLLIFFLSGSKVTKWRSSQKQKLEIDFKEGGQRNWLQVICNAGVAAELALIYMIDSGCAEYPVDFQQRYNASWLSVAVLGAIACNCGDTFASEIGSVVGSSEPWLLLTFRQVPKGTNGAVSLAGTVASIFGGFLVGLAYFVVLWLCADENILMNSVSQWPLLVLGGLCGLVGSLVDSFLGATLQYSGLDKKTGCIVQLPGDNVVHISGIPVLDNHGVNLLSSVILALLAPQFALYIWRYFVQVN